MENNTRKEPTFGTPTQPTPENIEKATQQAKANTPFSVHSTQSPGHTFTPVMTRPNELAKEFSTMEERKMLNTAEKAVATPAHTVAPNTTANLNTSAATTSTATAINTTPTQAAANPTVAPTTTTTATATASTNSNIGKTVQTSHFTFTPTENKHTHKAVETASSTVATGAAATAAAAATKAVETASSGMERVIPTQTPDNAKKVEKSPSKYRRLLLVGLLALALLLVFFLLKPKTPETVEALQNQGTDLPIEFRPLDEAEAKRAEEEAQALQAQQEAQQTQTTEQQSAENTPAEQVSTESPTQVNNVEANESVETAPVASATKPVNVEPIKPATKGSVIHQPETSVKVLKPATTTAKASQPTSSNANAKPTQAAVATKQPATLKPVAQQTKPVATATSSTQATKPSTVTAAATPAKTETNQAASNAVATKSFTIEKGVSLFQKFRDNGLGNNLSELNAMGKVNGATSRLSPGQKVTVRLDKENRIVEMNLGSGKYIRQANGSYIYK